MLVRNVLRDLWHEGCGQVADTARGEPECCIAPQDHNPSAINHIKHKLTNIKWFIVAPWPTSSCALTFDVSADSFCWFCTVNMMHTARARLRDLWVGRCLWCRPRSNNKKRYDWSGAWHKVCYWWVHDYTNITTIQTGHVKKIWV